ncbi:MAG: nucleotidyltransferase domain-containing protein [Staphylococcus sp.]|nr:nucleotidyltransferase domain-containing protein [Staphylococcus sp.]
MIFSKFIINIIYLIMLFQDNKIVKERVYEIYYDKIKSLSYLESKIKNISNSYNYILNNINQPISEDLLNQSYYLMTCELLERNIVDEILRIYYKNVDCNPHSLAALLHLYITNNITKNNIEFAFLISNYIMLKKDRWFLMPYEYCHNDYREAIKNNDLSSLIRIFYDIELVKKEKKPCLLSREEVIQKIKSIKEELVNNYYIEKLYLFGSFAKGNNTNKSDLDFVVIFNESLINKEKNDMIKIVKEYLKNEFDCDVDLLDFSYALNTFDKSQMEYLITLI